MTTLYARNYAIGKHHKYNGRHCDPPFTLPDPNGFRGYMDGYSGREFNEPKSPTFFIDKLKAEGVEFIKGDDVK